MKLYPYMIRSVVIKEKVPGWSCTQFEAESMGTNDDTRPYSLLLDGSFTVLNAELNDKHPTNKNII
jgi:hypothetical protein